MKKKAFQLYSDSRIAVDALTDEEAGQLIKAIFAHEDGEATALKGALQSTFLLISNQLDRDRERYEEMCARNSKNGSKGGRPSANGENPDEPAQTGENPNKPAKTRAKPKKADKDTDKDTEKEKDTDKEKEGLSVCGAAPRTHTASSPAHFKKPSVDEVKAYCAQRHNSVDAARFVDFYDSKGWMVGSSPMRDWRAAVRGWEQDARASPGRPAQDPGKPRYVPEEQYRFGR
jgi:hypothetical protein